MLTRDATENATSDDVQECCISCRFFDNSDKDRWDAGMGLCRRRAPVSVMPVSEACEELYPQSFARWPQVWDNDFCGEFELAQWEDPRLGEYK